jgi:WD40 repeat protein
LDADGILLAAMSPFAEQNDTVKIWNLADGTERTLRSDDERRFTDLDFLSDGRLLAAMDGGHLRLWDFESGESEVVWEEGAGGYLPFGEEPRVLIRDEGQWILQDLRTGKREDLPFTLSATSVGIDRAGEIIALGDGNGGIQVGRMDRDRFHLLLGHETEVSALAISRDGKRIASGGSDGTVRIWEMPDLKEPPLHTLPHAELLAKLKTLTNLRATEDENAASGWRVMTGEFPGWATAPTW